MSREIIEAVRTIEKEKGIEEDTLIQALEDALLAAYKKTPGATRHATVELDDFTVKVLYPDIAEMLQGASTDQPCPSPQFKLSRQARQRRSRRSNRIKA